MQPIGPGFAGGFFFLIWLLSVIAIIIGYVVFLVAVWRGMKAHEAIAETLKEITEHLKSQP
jgi:hypothetical protein